MALCGREQPLTKTNEHGYWRWWAIADMGASIHQRHRSHPGSPMGPNVLPPLISLCVCVGVCVWGGWGWLDNWWICFSPETNMSTSLLNILTGGKRQKNLMKTYKKKPNPKHPDHNFRGTKSNIWQNMPEVYGRFTQSYEKERREPGD